MSTRRWLSLIAQMGAMLLAMALRFYRLHLQDIWGDEAFSIFLSSGPLIDVIAGGADTHPPLYPLLLFSWLRLVGDTAFAARALSALIGILAVPLVFVTARKIVPGLPRLAWTATLLTATSPLLVYYSQETRMYELVAILSLASTYFAIRLLASEKETSRSTLWSAYLLTSLAAIYTHYSAFFVLASHNLVYVLQWLFNRQKDSRTNLLRWLGAQAFLFLAYVPWILVQSSFLSGKANTRFDEWSWGGLEMIVGKSLLAFSGGLALNAPLVHLLGIAFSILATVGIFASMMWVKGKSWQSAILMIVPVTIAWLLNPIMPFFFERYVLVALPAFYLTVAVGIEFFAQRLRMAYLAITISLLLGSVLALDQYYHNDVYAKGKYGQMMEYVKSQSRTGDVLILNNPLQKPLFEYYRPGNLPTFYFPEDKPLEDPSARARLSDVARRHSRIWLVMFGNPKEFDPTGYLERWLGENAFKAFARGYVDASLSLYVMPGPGMNIVHNTANARWGESINLVGYDIESGRLEPGSTIRLALYWQASTVVTQSFTVFTHLNGEWNPATNSTVWAQMDGIPMGGSRPTNSWSVGETLVDQYGLSLPPGIPPGRYVLEVGMYDPITMIRVPVIGESGVRMDDDRLILGSLEIK